MNGKPLLLSRFAPAAALVCVTAAAFLMGSVWTLSSTGGSLRFSIFTLAHLLSPLSALAAFALCPLIFGAPAKKPGVSRLCRLAALCLIFAPHLYTRFRGYDYWLAAPAVLRVAMPVSFDWLAAAAYGFYFMSLPKRPGFVLALAQTVALGVNYVLMYLSHSGKAPSVRALFVTTAVLLSAAFVCELCCAAAENHAQSDIEAATPPHLPRWFPGFAVRGLCRVHSV